MLLHGAHGLHQLAGQLRVRTGRLGRAQRVFLLLPLAEVVSPLLLAVQVRSPVWFRCCSNCVYVPLPRPLAPHHLLTRFTS